MRLRLQSFLLASFISKGIGHSNHAEPTPAPSIIPSNSKSSYRPTPLPTPLPTPIPTVQTCMEEFLKMNPTELKEKTSIINGIYHIDGKDCVGPMLDSKYDNERIYRHKGGKVKTRFDIEVPKFKRRVGSDTNSAEQVNGKKRSYFTKGFIIYHKVKKNGENQLRLGCPQSSKMCYIGFSKKIPDDKNGSFIASIKKRQSRLVDTNIFLITLASCIACYFGFCVVNELILFINKQLKSMKLNKQLKRMKQQNRNHFQQINSESISNKKKSQLQEYAKQIADPLKFLLINYGKNVINIGLNDLKNDNELSNSSLDKLESGLIQHKDSIIEDKLYCRELCHLISQRVKNETLTDNETQLKVSKKYFKQLQKHPELIILLDLSRSFEQLQSSLVFEALYNTLLDSDNEGFGVNERKSDNTNDKCQTEYVDECKSDGTNDKCQTEYDEVYHCAVNVKKCIKWSDDEEIVKLLFKKDDYNLNKSVKEELKKLDEVEFNFFRNYVIYELSIHLKDNELYKSRILETYYSDIKNNTELQVQLDIQGDFKKMEALLDTLKNEIYHDDDALTAEINLLKDNPSQYKYEKVSILMDIREQLFEDNLNNLLAETSDSLVEEKQS